MTDQKKYHHGNLPDALLAAAQKILSEKGIEGLSLRAVAREAGVSQAAPYHHFKDKRELFAAVAALSFGKLSDMMKECAADNSPTDPALMGYGVGYIEFARAYPHEFRLMFGDALAGYNENPEFERATQEAYRSLKKALTEASASINIPQEESQLDTMVLAAWALVHGLATLVVDRRIDLSEQTSAERRAYLTKVLASLNI